MGRIEIDIRWLAIVLLVACRSSTPDAAAVDAAPTAAKLAAYRAHLDDTDLTLHALRISWPGARPNPWRWPSWLPAKDARAALDVLAKLGATEPQLPAVDEAAHRYLEVMRVELPRWETLALAASDASRWNDEVVVSFDRFVAVSRALRDAVAAVPERAPPARSYAAMVRTCRAGSELAARATWVAVEPVERGSAAVAKPQGLVPFKPHELHEAGLACYRATLSHLEARGPDDFSTNYDAHLHMSMGMNLVDEEERRSRPLLHYSTFAAYAQSSAYAARRRHKFVGR